MCKINISHRQPTFLSSKVKGNSFLQALQSMWSSLPSCHHEGSVTANVVTDIRDIGDSVLVEVTEGWIPCDKCQHFLSFDWPQEAVWLKSSAKPICFRSRQTRVQLIWKKEKAACQLPQTTTTHNYLYLTVIWGLPSPLIMTWIAWWHGHWLVVLT